MIIRLCSKGSSAPWRLGYDRDDDGYAWYAVMPWFAFIVYNNAVDYFSRRRITGWRFGWSYNVDHDRYPGEHLYLNTVERLVYTTKGRAW